MLASVSFTVPDFIDTIQLRGFVFPDSRESGKLVLERRLTDVEEIELTDVGVREVTEDEAAILHAAFRAGARLVGRGRLVTK